MQFENAYVTLALAIGVSALVLRVSWKVAREMRRRREEEEAELLREYPELAELITQNQRR